MLSHLEKKLNELGKSEIQIFAKGHYKNKYQTKVQHVAVYQNDGTKYIKPAQFVQTAHNRHRGWKGWLQRAVFKKLFGRELHPLDDVGRRIAKDINRKVNRIDTRRLMHSFTHRIKKL